MLMVFILTSERLRTWRLSISYWSSSGGGEGTEFDRARFQLPLEQGVSCELYAR